MSRARESPAPPEDSDDEPYASVEGLTLDLAAGQRGRGRAVLEVSGGSCLEECILEMAASRCRPRGPAPPEDGEELYDEPCTPTTIVSPDDE